jgi:predicted nucleic acid-binding protein
LVAIDSSVWIEFFRGSDQLAIEEVRRLLDADAVAIAIPVRLELLSGASRAQLGRLRRVLSALPLLLPTPGVWSKLEGWIERAKQSGQRFGAMDLLIAGIADDNDASIWSRDADFARMQRLGFVRLHHPA